MSAAALGPTRVPAASPLTAARAPKPMHITNITSYSHIHLIIKLKSSRRSQTGLACMYLVGRDVGLVKDDLQGTIDPAVVIWVTYGRAQQVEDD